jgi:carbamoyl-phosphate synthase large subunit
MPERRAQAGTDLVDLGLSRAARPILAHVTEEDDPRVRQAIALAVARRQWEPGGSARVSELRAWARAELEHQGFEVVAFGPAFTRLSDMGGPRLPEREPQAAPASASGSPAAPAGAEPIGTVEPVEPLHWTPGAAPDVVDGAAAPAGVETAAQPS